MRLLRFTPFLLATLLLSGCATPHRAVSRPAGHSARPVAKTTTPQETPRAEAAATTSPVVKASTKPAAPEPGAGIPLMGFRPMKGQATPGI